MLTVEQVIELAKAGFSADEIRKYNEEPDQAQEHEQEQTQEQDQTQEQEQEQEKDNTVTREEFTALQSAIENLTKTVQASNVLNAHKGEKTLTTEEAADAALKAFLEA